MSCDKYNTKIYKAIKENGGWDNWEMLEIACYNCKNSNEARLKEYAHYVSENACLNSNSPVEIKTDTIKTPNIPKDATASLYKFECNYCNYKCRYKSDWDKHIITEKHKIETGIEDSSHALNYICSCGKSYSSKSNLGKHKKKCVNNQNNDADVTEDKPKMDIYDLVKYLMKENSELKTLLVDQTNKLGDVTLELVKNGINNTTNNNNNSTNHTNSHNKAFNLNFFLNETCKNAMNITDFVDSIKLQLSDFINIGETGFVEGISSIIVKNLNSLDETIRPIHCTDQKRETFYVKDENKWEKEDEDNKNIKKLIKNVTFKNENLMKTYKEKYPDYNDSESSRSDQYSKMVIEAMDCKEESRDKIIRNISKATTIKNK
jgi:hypothetical protein